MNLTEAYKLVYKDLISENSPSFFKGTYDAKNGKEDFMFGIGTIMEFIAYKADDNSDNFDNLFFQNMKKSKDKAKSDIDN